MQSSLKFTLPSPDRPRHKKPIVLMVTADNGCLWSSGQREKVRKRKEKDGKRGERRAVRSSHSAKDIRGVWGGWWWWGYRRGRGFRVTAESCWDRLKDTIFPTLRSSVPCRRSCNTHRRHVDQPCSLLASQPPNPHPPPPPACAPLGLIVPAWRRGKVNEGGRRMLPNGRPAQTQSFLALFRV